VDKSGRARLVRKRCLKLPSVLKRSLIAVTLLALAGCSLPTAARAPRRYPESDHHEVRILVDLAKANLQAKLDVQTREIIVQSVESLRSAYPHSALDDAGWDKHSRGSSGCVIKLVVGGSVYEYHGRVIGASYVLWRELRVDVQGPGILSAMASSGKEMEIWRTSDARQRRSGMETCAEETVVSAARVVC
jgi:hypothetical protein